MKLSITCRLLFYLQTLKGNKRFAAGNRLDVGEFQSICIQRRGIDLRQKRQRGRIVFGFIKGIIQMNGVYDVLKVICFEQQIAERMEDQREKASFNGIEELQIDRSFRK
jgi:hypothetical protein